MKRWLVAFTSQALNELSDSTFVSVHARTQLEAMAVARHEHPIPHPWTMATAIPWPRGARTIERAMKIALAATA